MIHGEHLNSQFRPGMHIIAQSWLDLHKHCSSISAYSNFSQDGAFKRCSLLKNTLSAIISKK